ncbi:MAG: tetratricopeptide repeat protein [Gemmatimonadales bacterium]
MQRTDSTRLTEAVAREVALRANAKVLVVPAISRIDSTYLLTMRIVDPGSGSDLRTRSDRAEGRGRVLTTLDRLVRGLRRDLGESRSELAANGVRLDQATTPSLDALLAWTEGNAAWNSRRFDDAEERYRAALGYDPQFAMANAMLGAYFSYIGRPDSSQVHFEAALAELDHLTEREQLRIRASYEQSVGNLPAAIRAQEVFVERYPDDLAEVYNLGSIYMRGRRPADAIRVLRDVVARDSTYVAAFINLATSHAINGTYAEAMPYYRRAFALRPDYRVSGNLNHEYGLAFLRLGQLDSAEATYRAMLDGTVFQQASGRRSLALLRMYQGRYAEAAGELETAVRLTRVSREPVSEFRNLLYLATVRTTAGRAPEALTAVRAAHGIADTLPLASPWLARLATRYHRLGDTGAVRRLLGLLRSRASANSPDDQMAVIGTEARLALASGDPAGAAERVREIQSLPGDSATEYEPLLATALDRMNQPAAADSAYRTVLGSLAPLGWEPQDDWLRAHLEFAELAERRGDTATSLEYYDRLLTLWRDGDRDLPPLVEARRRAATLRR